MYCNPRVSRSKTGVCLMYFGLVLGSVLLTSCQKNNRVPVFPVHGRVVGPQKEPAVGAMLVFYPADRDSAQLVRPLAYVDEEGGYQLTTYEEGDGAPCGTYVITVEWRERSASPFNSNREGYDRLRGSYKDPETSEFTFAVEENEENVVPTIHLE